MTVNVDRDVGNEKHLFLVGVQNWCTHYGSHCDKFSKNEEYIYYKKQLSTSGHISKGFYTYLLICVYCSFIYNNQEMENAYISINTHQKSFIL